MMHVKGWVVITFNQGRVDLHFWWIRIQQFFWMRIYFQLLFICRSGCSSKKTLWRVFLNWKNIRDCSKVIKIGACANLLYSKNFPPESGSAFNMRVRIQEGKWMRIRIYLDPQPCLEIKLGFSGTRPHQTCLHISASPTTTLATKTRKERRRWNEKIYYRYVLDGVTVQKI